MLWIYWSALVDKSVSLNSFKENIHICIWIEGSVSIINIEIEVWIWSEATPVYIKLIYLGKAWIHFSRHSSLCQLAWPNNEEENSWINTWKKNHSLTTNLVVQKVAIAIQLQDLLNFGRG